MICPSVVQKSRTVAPAASSEDALQKDPVVTTTRTVDTSGDIGGVVEIAVPNEVVGAEDVLARKEGDVLATFIEIDRLQDQGINVADIQKLKQAGYQTVLSVLQSTRKELSQLKGFAEAKVEKVLEAAAALDSSQCSFMTGSILLQRRANIIRLSTGSVILDKMLAGGIESSALTEVFGENRSGKTQICHTLCVTSQLPLDMGGGNGKVCYIDTEGTFRPEKIARIAERFGLSPEDVLDNILYARAHTHEHMTQLICMAACRMVEESFSLMIIDSIMALFRVEFSGRGDLAERQQVLGKALNRLQKIAEQFNVCVLYTNHVMADPSGAMTMVANPSKPIGGHVLGHASTHRLQLRIGRGDQRICKVYDSPCLPATDCVFQLSGKRLPLPHINPLAADQGVIDPTD
ncbi:meiotic recombination DMC1-like protein [Gregarina niphandrodes]|uniref:Meiotic recombination DMC1-like protein n=1 Tax=Gregarina niphandrodes TaxID=110365 RepID=A0A023BC73_GRENI|nr:meiotic recombination DMC1-like protein [Gregarina niphandrodes]EZG82423.1 meiotic recombination DMC1-like protein [Gregarina niphandrodes]|eukprot:XP_011128992.1 meiotic recombination DMC1-like protein [Gregarina niphandrodes]